MAPQNAPELAHPKGSWIPGFQKRDPGIHESRPDLRLHLTIAAVVVQESEVIASQTTRTCHKSPWNQHPNLLGLAGHPYSESAGLHGFYQDGYQQDFVESIGFTR